MQNKSHIPSIKSISWMAKNPVAANLFMLVFIIGGIIILFTQVRQEIFPAFEVDLVTISVAYPGASPDEVEKGILLAVEEAVQGIDGIKEIRSTASEGWGNVDVELEFDADKNKAVSDIKNEVDRISSFPLDAEEPIVSLQTTHRQVLSLSIYGNLDEKILRELAEIVRDDLLKHEKITRVELTGVRPLEISIEVPMAVLRTYNLTLDEIARQIRSSAIELPGGGVKTRAGEILLRTSERRDLGHEFENLSIISTRAGTQVRLGDIANIKDGFEEQDVQTFYNGYPCVMVNVFRTGDQTPIEVARVVKNYKKRLDRALPPGAKTAIRRDRSEIFNDRIDLLQRNALLGLFLVLGILGLFLEIRLAFWVTMGIPISFLGSFLFLPGADVSINMISLFAFIITLGMVVDDAIVVGENIYVHRQDTDGSPDSLIDASIKGASEVVIPVTFSIMTTIVAFAPMFFIQGTWGKIFRYFPAVIIIVLLISLFESVYILPAHLGHLSRVKINGLNGWFYNLQRKFSRGVEYFIQKIYGPSISWCIRNHWITWAVALFILIVAIGFVKGGRIKIVMFPKIESDWVTAEVTMPFGISFEETKKVQKRIETSFKNLVSELTQNQASTLSRGMSTYISATHKIRIYGLLVPTDQRNISASEFAKMWREKIGVIPGIKSLTFDSTAGGPRGGKPIDIQLIHKDIKVLEQAATKLGIILNSYSGVTDIDNGFSTGKLQLNFKIRPEAQSLGITATDIGRQTRNAFWGVEALRQQRGRDEIRVKVRLPRDERISEYDIEQMLIRTPDGGEIPLFRAAQVERGRSFTSINRTDSRRIIHVTAEVEESITTGRKVIESLVKNELIELIKNYPGLSYSLEGARRQGSESMAGLFKGFIIALLIMYVIIAIPFKSYIQPMIVLSAIPFGIVGAVLGHLIMGYNLSLISMMGLLALSGVVVNDSLILVHTANNLKNKGMELDKAVYNAGKRRFRPIILTSLTTFLGLTPMIFETSLQARFLIPMAISLGFGVLFTTFIILFIVPCFYLIIQDIKDLFAEIVEDAATMIKKAQTKLKSR